LRQLTYFEIGDSFCFDSLHGLYAGVFVSNSLFLLSRKYRVLSRRRSFLFFCHLKKKLLHLWLDTVRVDYSIKKQFSQLEKLLAWIHYPTTNRLPRALKYFTAWKANEFRMTLLVGYKYVWSMLKYWFKKNCV